MFIKVLSEIPNEMLLKINHRIFIDFLLCYMSDIKTEAT